MTISVGFCTHFIGICVSPGQRVGKRESAIKLIALCLIPSFLLLTIISTLQIRADVLKTYVESGGWKAFSWLMVFLAVYIASQVATSIWLAAWSDDPILNCTEAKQQSDYRLGFYGLFGILQGILYRLQL